MSLILEAIYFPLRNSSLKMFFGLCFLYAIQFGVQWLPIISILNIAFIGYIYATQFKIIFTTGNSYTDAPEFPDFSDIFDNILIPLFKVTFIWVVGFLPFILILLQLEELSETLSWALLSLGFLYVPVGLMIAALDELTRALNPMVVMTCIRRAGSSYVVMVLTFGLFTVLHGFIENAFAGSWILNSFISAYGIMFTGRLIGIVYRDRLADEPTDYIEVEDAT